MRLIGLLLLLAVIVVGYRQLTVPTVSLVLSESPAVTGQIASLTGLDVQPTGPRNTSGSMTPAMALDWCVSGACDASRFEQTPEANGVINPTSVHFRTGPPASFQIPAGVYVHNWDCFAYSEVPGPATIPQNCEGTFRRG
jgi:hypothetical protein